MQINKLLIEIESLMLICWLPACRRLLFPLLHAANEIGDVCTQANLLAEP